MEFSINTHWTQKHEFFQNIWKVNVSKQKESLYLYMEEL